MPPDVSRDDELADFFDNSNVGLHCVGADGTILRANQAELDLLGYRREEYVGRHIAEFHADRQVIDDILARLARGEELRERPAPLRHKDGSIRDVLISSNALFKDGRFVHTRCITIDITERKRNEETAREREAWLAGQREALAAALDNAPLPVSLGILVRLAAERLGPGVRAAFYLSNPEGTALHHVVGMADGYATAVDGFPIGPESLSCGLAAHTGKSILTADVTKEPLWKDWTWLAEKFGFRGCWSFPIHTTARRFAGTFAVYWPQPQDATPQHEALGELVVHAAGIIIARHQDAQIRLRAEEALRESEERFRRMADQAPVMVWVTEADGTCTFLSQSWYDFTGQTPQTGRGFGWLETTHPDDRAAAYETFRAANAKQEAFRLEYRLRRKDGEYRWAIDAASPRLSEAGEFLGYIGSVIDISERKQAEETQQVLLNELNHRVKNTLAVVQAIAQQTLARTRDPAEFVESFTGRILSLARAHNLLSEASWHGADLRELIRDQLLSGPVDESRLTAWGPALRLDSQMALYVALMLHELGTNSSKYGALSVPHGWVTISWTTDTALHLRWVERGGPMVATPSKLGFGTRLIQQSAKAQGGNARMLCEAEGVTWTISLPLPERSVSGGAPQLVRTAASASTEAAGDSGSSSLAGRRFLVIEDEPVIALDIIAALEAAQAQVEGPIGTAEKAIEMIERMPLDGVLLDANLGGRPVDKIASALTRRNVPFIFVTGHGRQGLPQAFQKVTVVSKPCRHQEVLDAAVQLVTPKPDVVRLRH